MIIMMMIILITMILVMIMIIIIIIIIIVIISIIMIMIIMIMITTAIMITKLWRRLPPAPPARPCLSNYLSTDVSHTRAEIRDSILFAYGYVSYKGRDNKGL